MPAQRLRVCDAADEREIRRSAPRADRSENLVVHSGQAPAFEEVLAGRNAALPAKEVTSRAVPCRGPRGEGRRKIVVRGWDPSQPDQGSAVDALSYGDSVGDMPILILRFRHLADRALPVPLRRLAR